MATCAPLIMTLLLLMMSPQIREHDLNVQVLGFVIFSVYRCFIFSVCFGFLPTYLGVPVVGRGAGILTLAQGIECAVNIPIGVVAINRLDGNFFWLNLAYTFASVPCVNLAWYPKESASKKESY